MRKRRGKMRDDSPLPFEGIMAGQVFRIEQDSSDYFCPRTDLAGQIAMNREGQ